jgi:hypothetical protein
LGGYANNLQALSGQRDDFDWGLPANSTLARLTSDESQEVLPDTSWEPADGWAPRPGHGYEDEYDTGFGPDVLSRSHAGIGGPANAVPPTAAKEEDSFALKEPNTGHKPRRPLKIKKIKAKSGPRPWLSTAVFFLSFAVVAGAAVLVILYIHHP